MLLLLFGIVGAIFYTYNQRQRENVTHEMSVMKNEFYNDAANRLRTPLTLIGAPVKPFWIPNRVSPERARNC